MGSQRTITIAGREVTPEVALRFEVVRGVLMGTMTLVQGANKLHIGLFELSRLVNGTRAAVIRELGEDALMKAREQSQPVATKAAS